MSKRNWAILVAVVLVATFGWLLYGGLNKNVVFFLTPKELLAKGDGRLRRAGAAGRHGGAGHRCSGTRRRSTCNSR